MKMFAALEALGRVFLDVANVIVGKILGDLSIALGMVEQVAWVNQSPRGRKGELKASYARLEPVTEPFSEVLLNLLVLMRIPVRDRVPNPK